MYNSWNYSFVCDNCYFSLFQAGICGISSIVHSSPDSSYISDYSYDLNNTTADLSSVNYSIDDSHSLLNAARGDYNTSQHNDTQHILEGHEEHLLYTSADIREYDSDYEHLSSTCVSTDVDMCAVPRPECDGEECVSITSKCSAGQSDWNHCVAQEISAVNITVLSTDSDSGVFLEERLYTPTAK